MADECVSIPANEPNQANITSNDGSYSNASYDYLGTLLSVASTLASFSQNTPSPSNNPASASAEEPCEMNETHCNEKASENTCDCDQMGNYENKKQMDDVPTIFPQKLMVILSNEDLSDIITWLPHGRGFIIYHKKKFATEVLPRYFKKTRYTSFTRKLKRWGFTRISRGPETGAYYHKFFLRSNTRLCLRMSCQSATPSIDVSTGTKESKAMPLQNFTYTSSLPEAPFGFSLKSAATIIQAREMHKEALRLQLLEQVAKAEPESKQQTSNLPITTADTACQDHSRSMMGSAINALQWNNAGVCGSSNLPLTEAIAFQERVKALAKKQNSNQFGQKITVHEQSRFSHPNKAFAA